MTTFEIATLVIAGLSLVVAFLSYKKADKAEKTVLTIKNTVMNSSKTLGDVKLSQNNFSGDNNASL